MQQYDVCDTDGTRYGPATMEMLRRWAKDGRIVAGMLISEAGANAWRNAETFPELADILRQPGGTSAGGRQAVEFPRPAPPLVLDPTARETGNRGGWESDPHANVMAYESPAQARMSALSIVSFVLSLVGVMPGCLCCALWIPLSIAGLVTGILALRQHKQMPQLAGRGFALAGVIISSIVLALGIISVIAYGALVATSVLKP